MATTQPPLAPLPPIPSSLPPLTQVPPQVPPQVAPSIPSSPSPMIPPQQTTLNNFQDDDLDDFLIGSGSFGGGKFKSRVITKDIYYTPKSIWQEKGSSISEKNACKEFGLQPTDLDGLTSQVRVCHGNPYRVFIRSEVEQRAKERKGGANIEAMKAVKLLKEINEQLASIEAQKEHLLGQKKKCEETIIAAGQELPSEKKGGRGRKRKL